MTLPHSFAPPRHPVVGQAARLPYNRNPTTTPGITMSFFDVGFWAVYAAILYAARRQRIFWPLLALALLLLFNALFTPGFYSVLFSPWHWRWARASARAWVA